MTGTVSGPPQSAATSPGLPADLIGPVLVVDLGETTFVTSSCHTAVAVRSGAGAVLGTCQVDPDAADEEKILSVLDQVADGSRVLLPPTTNGIGPGTYARVGWYNPFTGQVSVGAAVTGVTFDGETTLPLELGGSVGHVSVGPGQQLTLTVAGEELRAWTPTLETLEQALVSHPEWVPA